jgi:transcriptional regulator with XRE-family HTH domain
MSNFGDLVRRLRKERAMTLDQVAKKIGSHKGYVSGIENGKVNPPSVKFIRKFAKLFAYDEKEMVRIAWLDKAPKLIKDEVSASMAAAPAPAASGDLLSIPLINTTSTGYPTDLVDGRPRSLTGSLLSLPRLEGGPQLAATVCDNSMEQAEGFCLSKGDLVLLAPVTRPRNGGIVFVIYNSKGRRSALIRQVMLEQNEHVVLQPLNKDYPLEFLTHDDIDAMYAVVGRLEIFADASVNSRSVS